MSRSWSRPSPWWRWAAIAVLGALTYFRLWGYLWTEWFTSVDHKRIGVMYMVLGLVMLLRGFCRRDHDAPAAGDGVRRLGRLSAGASLRPGLHRAWRDHDLLRGDAVRHRTDELRRAAADRRARRLVPVPQQFQLLDDRRRRGHRHDVAVRRRVRPHRLAGLSAALGHRLQSRCRRGLLHLGAAGGGHRHAAVRRQPDRHHRQDACARHDDDEDAGLHLDRAVHQRPDRRRLPGADRGARAACRSTAMSARTSSPTISAAIR